MDEEVDEVIVEIHLADSTSAHISHNNRTICGKPWMVAVPSEKVREVTNNPEKVTCDNCRERWFK